MTPLPALPAPHVLSQHAYPSCCGVPTRLSATKGWHCGVCDAELPFRDDEGRDWPTIRDGQALDAQARETAAVAKRVTSSKKGRDR